VRASTTWSGADPDETREASERSKQRGLSRRQKERSEKQRGEEAARQ
jgi:hypothetical protein